MNIEEILDLMEGLLDKSTSVPFSNKKLIDCDQMGEYIDTMRNSLPVELKRAKDLARDQKKIIAESNKQADSIIKRAEERAKVLVSEQEIMKQATEYAKEQLKRAKDQADEIVATAMAKDKDIRNALAANVEKVLSEAERVLDRSLSDVAATKVAVLKIGTSK